MKVLLKTQRINIGAVLADTILVWFLTTFIGSTCVWIFTGLEWSAAFFLSLMFSAPLAILAIPNFYVLYSIQTKRNRIRYAFSSVLILSLLLFAILLWFFDLDATDLAGLMSPYLAGAEITFFTVAGKFIFRNNEPTNTNAHES